MRVHRSTANQTLFSNLDSQFIELVKRVFQKTRKVFKATVSSLRNKNFLFCFLSSDTEEKGERKKILAFFYLPQESTKKNQLTIISLDSAQLLRMQDQFR